jgi:hypothetical protein
VHIIRFRLTPAMRAELPAGVSTWLLPAQLAWDRISADQIRNRRT